MLWETVFTCCPHMEKKETNAMPSANVVQTGRKRSPWQHHLFGFGFEHLCCARSTTSYANALGNHLSPDLAVHLIHFNIRFDVPEMLHYIFMLAMPSWAFLGLYQVRSLVGGQGPMTSDARRHSIKMSLSFVIAYQFE